MKHFKLKKVFSFCEFNMVKKGSLTNTKSTLKEELLDVIIDWIKNSTSHGLPNIARAPNVFIRILWIVFFISSIAYCSVVIIRSLVLYFQYETTISISENYESPTMYPSVTFCNLNPFNEQYSLEYMNSKSDLFGEINCTGNDISNISSWVQCFNTDNPDDILTTIIDKLKRSISNDNLTDELLFYFGFDLAVDMMISCKYNNQKCTADNFTKFWSNQYGFCYTFNSGLENKPILMTSEAGPNYGLRVELAVQPPNNTIFAYRNGLYLLVHNQSMTPTTLTGGIYVSTGAETYIGVTRTFHNKQKTPFSDCITDLTPFSPYSTKLFGYFADLNVTYYDQELCVDLCYQDKLIDKCGCCDLITKSIRHAVYCQSDSELLCLSKFDNLFSSSNTNSFCDNVCRQQCQTQIFVESISEASYPTSSYLNLLNALPNINGKFPVQATSSQLEIFAQQSLLKFVVNYNELSYTTINENPSVTFDTLLANIGGQLGLFIGISVLSLIELIEIISEIVIVIYTRKQRIKENKVANIIEVKPIS